jgi:hypothetical protein
MESSPIVFFEIETIGDTADGFIPGHNARDEISSRGTEELSQGKRGGEDNRTRVDTGIAVSVVDLQSMGSHSVTKSSIHSRKDTLHWPLPYQGHENLRRLCLPPGQVGTK